MTLEAADEIQALIQYHAMTIGEQIEDGGLKPSQQPVLVKTIRRMLELAEALKDCKIK